MKLIPLVTTAALLLSACGSATQAGSNEAAPIESEVDAGAVASRPTEHPVGSTTCRTYGWYGDPAGATNPDAVIRGTWNTPMLATTADRDEASLENFWTQKVTGESFEDGIKGMVKNFSSDSILIEARRAGGGFTQRAVLEPQDVMPYLFPEEGEFIIRPANARIGDSGATPVKIWLSDPYMGRPDSRVEISEGGSQSETWSEEEDHAYESSNGPRIWIKRETDGWTASVSDQYGKQCFDGVYDSMSDWAVFSIHVDRI